LKPYVLHTHIEWDVHGIDSSGAFEAFNGKLVVNLYKKGIVLEDEKFQMVDF
jgi:hypothetical protein